MTTTDTEADAATRVRRAARWQRLRWRVTPVVALVVWAALPWLLVHEFQAYDHLRRTRPVVDAVVTSVRVHHGKHRDVDVDIRTAAGSERIVGGGVSARHPPVVGGR